MLNNIEQHFDTENARTLLYKGYWNWTPVEKLHLQAVVRHINAAKNSYTDLIQYNTDCAAFWGFQSGHYEAWQLGFIIKSFRILNGIE